MKDVEPSNVIKLAVSNARLSQEQRRKNEFAESGAPRPPITCRFGFHLYSHSEISRSAWIQTKVCVDCGRAKVRFLL